MTISASVLPFIKTGRKRPLDARKQSVKPQIAGQKTANSLDFRQIIVGLAIACALALCFIVPAPLDRVQAATLGIVLVTLALWGTAIVPNYLAALIFFAVTLILHLAKPELVFSGFSSAAVWLIISGFVIGSAINISGLGDRMAGVIAPAITGSYPRLIAGLMLVSMLLGFLMPSSVGRAVALVPIGMALAERCGFAPGSNGRIGIAVVLAIGCNMPSFAILPSNIPNMVLSGAAETIYGTHFSYLDYLILHYPVLGILKSIVIVALVVRLFPARIETAPAFTQETNAKTPSKPGSALRVALILMITLALWATDNIHGVSPAWIGLATAVVLLLPKVGVVSPPAFKASADFGTVLFVAGALALGAIVNASGLGTMGGEWLKTFLPIEQGRAAMNFLSLTAMSFVTGLFSTIPGVPAVLTPMAKDLANLTGFSLDAVLMTQVIGFSTVLFPYQVGPLVVAMQLSGEKLGHLMKVTLPLTAITLFALTPVDYLWWKFLGWI